MDLLRRSEFFREPECARKGGIFVGLGLLCFGIYGYFLVVRAYVSPLFLALGSLYVLVGLPEFLPSERTTLAGVLRITVILSAIVVMGYVILQY
jgi:hypothetical protein